MKRVLFLPVILCLLLSCAETTETNSSKKQKELKDSLTAAINTLKASDVFNGFAVSIVNEKGTLYQRGFGSRDISRRKNYTDSTLQPIGSISKTFVGLALLKAQELGKLKLDDPVNKYLPFKVRNPYFPNEEITIRHLATHTSGIADNDYYLSKNYYLKSGQDLNGKKLAFEDTQVFNPADSAVSIESFLKNLVSEKGKWRTGESFLNKKPGESYEYSNTATTLAAYIVERATGQSFDAFTAKHILKPLNMRASGWHFDEVDLSNYSGLYENPSTELPYYFLSSYPDGGFITSINDLSLYLTELIKGYNGHGTILSKESYKELFRPQLNDTHFTDRNTKNPYSESFNVGIFMGLGYTGYIGHTGGDPGLAAMMFFNPETSIGRIMMVNTSFSDKKGNDMFYAIWDQLEKFQNKLSSENEN